MVSGWMRASNGTCKLEAIAIMCDMSNDDYKRVKDERGGTGLICMHIAQKRTCKLLKELASLMLVDYNSFDEPSLVDLSEIFKGIKFQKKF